MVDARNALTLAEQRWKSGDDMGTLAALSVAATTSFGDVEQTLEYCRSLLRMRQIWASILTLRSAVKLFQSDYRIPDLLVDACFQIGDADGALEAYAIALARGLPAQTEAVRRVARVAIWCGRLTALEPLLGDPSSAPFQAECHALLTQERVAFDLLEARRLKQFGPGDPHAQDINQAAAEGDPAYASHLYIWAARSETISEQQLLKIAYDAFPPFGQVPTSLAFLAWRLLKRFPDSAPCKLEVGINGLLQFGDATGATAMLEATLLHPAALESPGAADRVVRLATSCAVFGILSRRRVAEICGTFWHLLSRPDYAVLANGFAAHATEARPVGSMAPDKRRPRVALCVSGQLRSFRLSWPSITTAAQGCDITVFVSTWAKTGAGLGTGDGIGRKLPQSIRSRLAGSFQTRRLFSERYPSTFQLFSASDTISAAECAAFFGTEFVRVHDEEVFEQHYENESGLLSSGSLNQAKMYFGIHDAMAWKKQYEIDHHMRFDAVLRLRPDLQMKSIGLTDIAVAASNRVALSTDLRFNAVGDVFLVMSSEVSDIVGGIWPAVERAKSFAVVPGGSGAAAETALFETLCWNGVRVQQLRDSEALSLNSVEASVDDIWRTLQVDLRRIHAPNDIDVVVASAVSEAAGKGAIATLDALVSALGAKGVAGTVL